MSEECTHLDQIVVGVEPSGDGCKECMETGGRWMHLRRCAVCGHIGCCDSSPGKHATKHAHETGHAIMQSYEPGEDWLYCTEDELHVRDRRDARLAEPPAGLVAGTAAGGRS